MNFYVNNKTTPRELYMYLFDNNIMNADVFQHKFVTREGMQLNPHLTFAFQRVLPFDTIYLLNPNTPKHAYNPVEIERQFDLKDHDDFMDQVGEWNQTMKMKLRMMKDEDKILHRMNKVKQPKTLLPPQKPDKPSTEPLPRFWK